MSERLTGVVLLPTNGGPAGAPVDVAIEDGRIAAIAPASDQPKRRLLAMPAPVNRTTTLPNSPPPSRAPSMPTAI